MAALDELSRVGRLAPRSRPPRLPHAVSTSEALFGSCAITCLKVTRTEGGDKPRRFSNQPSLIWACRVSGMSAPLRFRLFSAFSNCLSETGFCRRMRSRSFSRASTLAVSFFSWAVTTFKSGSLILPFSRPPSQIQVEELPKVNSQLASEPLGSARTGESHIGDENIKGTSWGRQCANLGLREPKKSSA